MIIKVLVFFFSSPGVPRRKDTLGDLFGGQGSSSSSGGTIGGPASSVSNAIDVRLELRVDLMADVRTRVIAQKDAHTLHNAIHAPIPVNTHQNVLFLFETQ